MTKKNQIKHPAFTLVELLVALGLSTIVLAGAYAIYTISTKSYRLNTAQMELAQNARISLERMSRDIRQGVEIITALPENPTTGTPANEIKFQDGHNYWPGAGSIQYVTYYLSGTDLHRKVSHYSFAAHPDDWVLWSTKDLGGNSPLETTDSDQIKAEKISLLQFWGRRAVTIKIDTADTNQTYHFQTQSLGRNMQ